MKRTRLLNFDDRNLPVNNLTPERIREIEKLAMPILAELLEKLRKEKPESFKPIEDK